MSDATMECALDGCSERFVPKRRTQKFCTPQHGQRAYNLSKAYAGGRPGPRPTIKTDEERSADALARRVLQVETGRARAQVEAKQAKLEIREKDEEIEQLRHELELLTTDVKVPRWMTPKGARGDKRATLVALFSDSHYGEVVNPAEMVGYNAYDMSIAEKRTRRFFERTVLVARNYLAGVDYDGIVMPMLGDIVSGDIHDEFQQTNEMSTYETILEVVPWIAAGIEMFLDEFGKVHIPAVPGNHPRNSRKPRFKRRTANNADALIVRWLADRFRDVDGVTFDVPESISADFKIYNTAFRCEHGDEARGGGGIQGALLPITLRTHKVRKQAQSEGAPFDVLLMGHWHQLMSNPAKGFIVNGSLKGYDEFARAKGFEPEPPQQALMVVTPEHGVTVQAPLFVADRKDEGW